MARPKKQGGGFTDEGRRWGRPQLKFPEYVHGGKHEVERVFAERMKGRKYTDDPRAVRP